MGARWRATAEHRQRDTELARVFAGVVGGGLVHFGENADECVACLVVTLVEHGNHRLTAAQHEQKEGIGGGGGRFDRGRETLGGGWVVGGGELLGAEHSVGVGHGFGAAADYCIHP
jgi:hypothetical protein